MTQRLLLAFALLLAPSTPALAKDDYVYGPEPDWHSYIELGAGAVRAKLAEPAVRARLPATDWSIEWPNGPMQGGWRHKGRFPGYLTCGRLRAQTPVEGRSPVVNFVVVIDRDAVKTVDISSRESNSLVNVMCEALVRKGFLPPARLVEVPKDTDVASMGITIRSMPEGAYVVAATPDGDGQRAGLTPGMVVTRVNGVALAGIGDAMSKILASDTPRLDLETVTGDRLTVERRR
jgi:hypothetical protein